MRWFHQNLIIFYNSECKTCIYSWYELLRHMLLPRKPLILGLMLQLCKKLISNIISTTAFSLRWNLYL